MAIYSYESAAEKTLRLQAEITNRQLELYRLEKEQAQERYRQEELREISRRHRLRDAGYVSR